MQQWFAPLDVDSLTGGATAGGSAASLSSNTGSLDLYLALLSLLLRGSEFGYGGGGSQRDPHYSSSAPQTQVCVCVCARGSRHHVCIPA